MYNLLHFNPKLFHLLISSINTYEEDENLLVDCSLVVILKLSEIIHSLSEVEEEIEVLEA